MTQQLTSEGPLHPALLPIVVAMANYHEAVWKAAKAGNAPPDAAGGAQAKALLDLIGAELEKAAPPQDERTLRERRHLMRCAIALVQRPELSEVAEQSRTQVAQQLQVALAATWDAPTSAAGKSALPRFPAMLRKMWSAAEVQAWIDENWAAPASAAGKCALCHGPKHDTCNDHTCKFLEASPGSDAPTERRDSITLSAAQLKEALVFVAPDFEKDKDQREQEVSIQWCPARASTEGEHMPAGLYCWLTEYPEEGCIPLTGENHFGDTNEKVLPELESLETGEADAV